MPQTHPEPSQSASSARMNRWTEYPLVRLFLPKFREDLSATYSRNLNKWLVIAPVIGLSAGLTITAVAYIILHELWPRTLAFYLRHHWAIIPGLVLGGTVAGLIMQFLTPNPNEHSTEEVIRAYHEHEGRIDTRASPAKLVAAIATIGLGGSAALEGPAIYGGAALGSWLWVHIQAIRRLGITARDRRIMLICGAAAGMSAVFRAPLTGIVFALEMPYKDDLAHEALLPSLIASVVSYITLSAFLGKEALFDFESTRTYAMSDLLWCALLGLGIGLIAAAFVVTFRHLRALVVRWVFPHWGKLAIGGFLTGLAGLLFIWIYPGKLIPIGPNYEVVGYLLNEHHSSTQLVVFALLKLTATLATVGSGGVSAMFIPLFLTGGDLGLIFAQSFVHSPILPLYAAVGMASFLAAAYKTPLAAVVFVAEATGGHAFIIPALIGAAVAYAASGDASVSGDQRLHEEYIPAGQVLVPMSELADLEARPLAASAPAQPNATPATIDPATVASDARPGEPVLAPSKSA